MSLNLRGVTFLLYVSEVNETHIPKHGASVTKKIPSVDENTHGMNE